jgi:homoserine O-acetyltransferase/O-succinyltransferase
LTKTFHHPHTFVLENGDHLPSLDVAYTTYGLLNATKTNVIWICHALTANSETALWWNSLVGLNKIIDTNKYFVVCANIIGSCYGSSGPLSINPVSGLPYFNHFPQVSIRDMVNANIILQQHLGIDKISLLLGGSMGGYQVLEWCVMAPNTINNIFLIATAAVESAWAKAIHAAQRLAIEADATWQDNTSIAGANGLKAARAIGILSYRNYQIFKQKQSDEDENKLDNYKAASYINYQGQKLTNRFNAYSYWLLTKSMDTHNIARGRNKSAQEILDSIKIPALVMGISSDILCPLAEQQFLANHLAQSTYVTIDSDYGHDGFIIEGEKIGSALKKWMKEKNVSI